MSCDTLFKYNCAGISGQYVTVFTLGSTFVLDVM